ncbi:MAG: 3-alpha,7-alpha,12-alpha-trihydroxy-5-beta-cholest-24-enoyl-CoA hydratase [Woeseiaceae bacterium]|nr:3-alpha,7-alpha,12-alpha-trihydroxy-5-beta-cholest-24-enoyl-CoA hydratase [Woeseiaceae bacterium]
MAFDYDTMMATSIVDLPFAYRDTETMLYALSIGLGRDPLDANELPFVADDHGTVKTVPSLATVLIPDMFPPDLGWDYSQVLHAEQRLTLFRPLPPAAELRIDKRIVDVFDRGPKLGAMVLFEAEGRFAKDDTVLFTLSNTIIARGDGGFGGPNGKGPAPHRVPRREADLSCDLQTRPDQALLYRLNGDRNPLHSDPALSPQVGFDRPILHGLCTYGIACHAIMKTICEYDYTLITGLDARFSSPVLPGDTIMTEMWQDGNIVSFQCTAKERGIVVLKNGKCTLAA